MQIDADPGQLLVRLHAEVEGERISRDQGPGHGLAQEGAGAVQSSLGEMASPVPAKPDVSRSWQFRLAYFWAEKMKPKEIL